MRDIIAENSAPDESLQIREGRKNIMFGYVTICEPD